MKNDVVRALLIDDDEDDFVIIRSLFQTFTGRGYQLEWVSTYEAGLEAILQNGHDVYLIDYRLGENDGLKLVRQVSARNDQAPVILLTGKGGYEIDVQAMDAGASDYLVKDQINADLLERSIRYAIEQKRAEARLARQAARSNALLRVAARLNEKLSLEAVSKAICEETARALNAPASALFLYEPSRWKFYYAADFGLPLSFRDQAVPVSRPLYQGYTLRSNPVTILSDLRATNQEANLSRYIELGLTSLARIIILRGDQPLGILYVYGRTEQPLVLDDADDIATLRGLADQSALAISNTRLHEQERARSNELASISYISSFLREAQDSHQMLPLTLREANKLLRADGGAVLLWNRLENRIDISIADGILAPASGLSFPVDQGISSLVVKNGHPYLTPDYANDADRLTDLPGLDQIGPAVFVPVRSEVDTLGVLMLARQRAENAQPFQPAEVRLLAAIGEMVGNSLRRTILFEDAQRQMRFTQALNEIDRVIASSLDLQNTLHAALSKGISELKVDAAAVLLFDSKTQILAFAAGCGFRTEGIRETRVTLGSGPAGAAALDRRLIHLDSLSEKTGFLHSSAMKDEGFVSYLTLPLIIKDELKGVLEIYHRSSLNPDDNWLEFLNTYAGQIAVAVDNALLFESLQRSSADLVHAYESTLEGWSRALDLRDKETEGHTQRVTELTLKLAQYMGVYGEDLIHVRRGALLHDIGKMAIPDNILLKPGPLSDDEWEVMRQHSSFAYHLLSPIDYLRPSLDIPYCHHERWDGSGYPRQLKGAEIPLPARIFAVVDVWDALCSDRPYRLAWPTPKAADYIREQSGKHFDPEVSNVFLQMVENDDL